MGSKALHKLKEQTNLELDEELSQKPSTALRSGLIFAVRR